MRKERQTKDQKQMEKDSVFDVLFITCQRAISRLSSSPPSIDCHKVRRELKRKRNKRQKSFPVNRIPGCWPHWLQLWYKLMIPLPRRRRDQHYTRWGNKKLSWIRVRERRVKVWGDDGLMGWEEKCVCVWRAIEPRSLSAKDFLSLSLPLSNFTSSYGHHHHHLTLCSELSL